MPCVREDRVKKTKPAPRPGASKHDGANKDGEGLTPQQARFVELICADPTHNGREAAKGAGYGSPDTRASELRKLPAVRRAIDARFKEINDRLGLKAEKVLAYLHDAAFVDPIVYENVRSLAELRSLTPEQRRAVVGYSYTQSGDFVLELAIEKSRELLGKHFKLFTDKLEIKDSSGLAAKLAAARRRRAEREKK